MRLPGKAEPVPDDQDAGVGQFIDDVQVAASYRITAPTRAASEPATVEQGLDDGAVVEIEYEDGLREWVSVARLAELQGAPGAEAFDLAAAVPGDPDRGVGDLFVKGVRILTGRAAEELAPRAVQAAIAKVEGRLEPGPGLYRVGLSGKLDEPGELDTDQPYLLFLHGTASSTHGSYSGLFAGEGGGPTTEWSDLHRRYAGRILAFEHHTLSESPVDNAIDLLGALKVPGIELHLVSHSRGGLIGDLLSLDAIPESAVTKFHRKRRRHAGELGLDAEFVAREKETLERLSAELASLQPHVGRYVRVAAPARGTRLAGERLDRLLSILTNLVGLVPMGAAGKTLHQFVKALTLEVARLRANPASLPGIEAMMPKSPFVHLLNLPEVSTGDDLAVVAGDVEGRGVINRLAIWATDLFYGVPHDLVVNTDAMSEGVRRRGKPVMFFHRGSDVTHFGYFRGRDSRKDLHAWLTRAEGGKVDGALPLQQTRGSAGLTAPKTRSTEATVPTVVLVPTALATHLAVDGERVWLDADAIGAAKRWELAMDRDSVRAEAVIDDPYHDLVEALSGSFQVQAFPFDWRRPLADTAAALRAVLSTHLAQGDNPVHVVAHGIGGLAVWAAAAADPELWRRLRSRDGRVVMIGVPDRGAHGILQLLAGAGVLFDSLDTVLADPALPRAKLAEEFRSMPGLVEALPADPATRAAQSWQRWLGDGAEGIGDLLEAAQGTTDAIAAAVREHTDDVLRIAGRAAFTPAGVVAGDDGLSFPSSAEGDGLALDASQAIGKQTWWAAAANGDLPSRPEVIRAVQDLVASGTCSTLSQAAPKLRTVPGALPPWMVQRLYPTDRDLVAAALFSEPPRAAEPDEERHLLTVSVSHGSLEHADGPVLVGHYQGDPIVGAESFLNWRLRGRLSSRHALGVYPEDVGSHEVVLAPGIGTEGAQHPPGAIVVGLGEVGKLNASELTRSVTQAALRYAVEYSEAVRPPRPGAWRPAAISSLLVGSNSGMALTIETSIGAIVKGVVLANRALRNLGFWDRVRIDKLEFMELYLDVATRAAHTVADLARHVRLPTEETEEIYGRTWLQPKPGGQPGRSSFEYDTGWWRRLQITDASDGSGSPGTVDLKFQALTDRARAEETKRSTQSALIDELVASAIGGSGDDVVTGVLFELLLPNTLKEQSNEPANLQLVVDRVAAAFPWEMLTDRADGRDEPLAIQRGVLRQLTTARFRRRIESPRGHHALVVGDPDLEGMPGYRQLPGALREGRAVAEALKRAGYEVNEVVDEDITKRRASHVITRLFDRSKEYSIVHIAAHGQFVADDVHRSGVVIGNGKFLTSAEIDQLRVVPDLVFLNCCHLGKFDDPSRTDEERELDRRQRLDLTRFAASISEQLIEIGVGAVVAAGWAVDDEAAAQFASVFYDRITGGAKLGDAVLAARQAAHELGGTTWGAYQVYGSPDFRLAKEPGAETGGDVRVVAAHEYEAELRQLSARARNAYDQARIEALGRELDDLVVKMRPEWSTGAVLDALGGCFGELRRFDRAIKYYRMALDSWDASAPLEVLDEMLNLVARHAVDRVRAAGGEGATLDKACKDCLAAIDKVKGLLKAAPTPERHALAGSIYKRVARITADGVERKKLLGHALREYEEAQERYALKREGRKDRPEVWPRYGWNIAVLRWLLGKTNQAQTELVAVRDAAESLLGSDAQEEYWTRLVFADVKMLEALIDDSIAGRVEELADAYQEIPGATPKMRSSPVEQIEFLRDMLDVTRYGAQRREQMAAALDRLCEVLQ